MTVTQWIGAVGLSIFGLLFLAAQVMIVLPMNARLRYAKTFTMERVDGSIVWKNDKETFLIYQPSPFSENFRVTHYHEKKKTPKREYVINLLYAIGKAHEVNAWTGAPND